MKDINKIQWYHKISWTGIGIFIAIITILFIIPSLIIMCLAELTFGLSFVIVFSLWILIGVLFVLA